MVSAAFGWYALEALPASCLWRKSGRYGQCVHISSHILFDFYYMGEAQTIRERQMNKTRLSINLSKYHEDKPHRKKQLLWRIVNATVFRLLPGTPLRYFRNLILRAFGAQLPLDVSVFSTAKIFAPWNLKMGKNSCIGPHAKIYNKAHVTLGDNAVISQGAFLCTAGHDITDPKNSLITSPIVIGDYAWVAADAFVNMGVTIGEGAVVGARAAVFKDVQPWTVVGGNPANFIKQRSLSD